MTDEFLWGQVSLRLTYAERRRFKMACVGKGETMQDVGRRLLLAYASEWEQEQQDAAARVRAEETGRE